QRWDDLKANAPETWESIKTGIQSRWEALKANAPTAWEEIKTAIVTRFGEAKDNVLTFAQQLRDDPSAAWAALVERIKEKRDTLFSSITGPWEDAKKTVLGIVDEAKNWGRNLVSNIVDGIKQKA